MTSYESWGRFPHVDQEVLHLASRHDRLPIRGASSVLPRGQGRSYGDSCLNDGGALLTTERLSSFIAFDRRTGILRCEAGVTLDEILRLIVPAGWFLPVTPGTKFVSVGGAIANDVHGKNHHVAGCFGSHVARFELLRSSGERLVCGPAENAEWFRATIGGMGLTGLITWAELQLIPISNPWIVTENVALANLDDFFRVSAESAHYTYTVAWIDSLARGRSLGRGVFMRGEHAPAAVVVGPKAPRLEVGVPFDMPELLLNRLSIKAFNTLYFEAQRRAIGQRVVHYEPFFYPLDSVLRWNRVYGRRGFVQYQCVVPYGTDADRAPVEELLRRIAASTGSFLTVLKAFGDVPSPGMMSFPRPGITLALDFPFEGEKTLRLCTVLDDVVRAAGGVVYPAKDARMSPDMFRACYPQWSAFAHFVDPKFSSSFWRRVTAA